MSEVLSKKTIYAHGSLGLPLAVIGYPLSIWIPAHYSGGLGISLAAVGTILMLARLTDVITDPIMGEISDRWRTPFGRRRPWLLIGAPVMMLGVYNLFVPDEGVGMAYFLVWLTVFFVGATMIGLPHRAWGAELSPDYHQRSRVTAAREIYVLVGLMVAAAVPMIVEIRADGGASVGQVFSTLWSDAIGAFSGDFRDKTVVDRATLTGPVLAGLAWTIILVLPLCAAIVLLLVKEPPPTAGESRPSFREGPEAGAEERAHAARAAHRPARHLRRGIPERRVALLHPRHHRCAHHRRRLFLLVHRRPRRDFRSGSGSAAESASTGLSCAR